MSKCPKFWDNQESVFKTFPSPYIFTEKFRPQKINGINLITKKKKKEKKSLLLSFPNRRFTCLRIQLHFFHFFSYDFCLFLFLGLKEIKSFLFNTASLYLDLKILGFSKQKPRISNIL